MNEKEWNEALFEGVSVQAIKRRIISNETLPWIRTIIELTHDCHSILELGSGTGEISAHLAMLGKEVALVDFNSQAINFSEELFRTLSIGGMFMNRDALSMYPINLEGQFDCVFSSGLLEHFTLSEQNTIMDNSIRVCKNGGRIISLVPNAKSVFYRIGKWIQERRGTWKWGHEVPAETMNLNGCFNRKDLTDIYEFTISPEHSLNFLTIPGIEPFIGIARQFFSSNDMPDQGYLLCTVAKVNK